MRAAAATSTNAMHSFMIGSLVLGSDGCRLKHRSVPPPFLRQLAAFLPVCEQRSRQRGAHAKLAASRPPRKERVPSAVRQSQRRSSQAPGAMQTAGRADGLALGAGKRASWLGMTGAQPLLQPRLLGLRARPGAFVSGASFLLFLFLLFVSRHSPRDAARRSLCKWWWSRNCAPAGRCGALELVVASAGPRCRCRCRLRIAFLVLSSPQSHVILDVNLGVQVGADVREVEGIAGVDVLGHITRRILPNSCSRPSPSARARRIGP